MFTKPIAVEPCRGGFNSRMQPNAMVIIEPEMPSIKNNADNGPGARQPANKISANSTLLHKMPANNTGLRRPV